MVLLKYVSVRGIESNANTGGVIRRQLNLGAEEAMVVKRGGDEARPCEAVEEEADAFSVRGADEIAVAEERVVSLVEWDGGEIERHCVGKYRKSSSEREKKERNQSQRPL